MCRTGAPSATCARPTCIRYADQRLAAAGTQHALDVCTDDVRWAKEQIVQDFPGRTVTRAFLLDDVDTP